MFVSFDQFELNEAKQVGIVYHYTKLESLIKILEGDFMIATNYKTEPFPYVSFTRDKNFHTKGSRSIEGLACRLVVDGDKMSNKYHFEPFADIEIKKGDDEMEERVVIKKGNKDGIVGIKKYVKHIDVFSYDAVDEMEDAKFAKFIRTDKKLGKFYKKSDIEMSLINIVQELMVIHDLDINLLDE